MKKESEVKKDLEVIAIDFIAAMTYQTALNVECLQNKVMKLPQMPLKDVGILFVENQRSWANKLMRGLKAIGLDVSMQRDLNGQELQHYSIICEFARQTYDMEAAANLMEHIANVTTITDEIQEQIIQLLNTTQCKKQ